MRIVPQGGSVNVSVLMVGTADHISGTAGLTLTIEVAKNGGAFATVTPTVTSRGYGWHTIAAGTSIWDTLGDVSWHVTCPGTADPSDWLDQCVYPNMWPSLSGGTANVGTATTLSGNVAGNVGGSVTGSVASVAGNLGGNVGGSVTGSVASVAGNLTGNVGGSVTGSVASVAGAVGSVTGNVGGSVTGSVGSVAGAVGSVTGNVGGSVTGSVGSVAGNLTGNVGGSVTGSVASVVGNVGGSVTGSVGSVAGAVGSVTGSVGSVAGTVAANVVQISGDSAAADNLEAYTDGSEYMPVDAFAQDFDADSTPGQLTVYKPDGSTPTAYSPKTLTTKADAQPITKAV